MAKRQLKRRRPRFDPPRLVRLFLLREAETIRQRCSICHQDRPCVPAEDGEPVCGPCHYGSDLLQREHPPVGTCCNDCAFRRGSDERQPTDRYNADGCATELDHVKRFSSVFYCHKPFLEPQQEWGFDRKTGDLIPLYGEHWRPCAGWWAEMCRRYGMKAGPKA